MRWLHDADEDDAPTDPWVPDALAVFNDDGELIGWDESAEHAYLAERGEPGGCGDDCAARGHVELWA